MAAIPYHEGDPPPEANSPLDAFVFHADPYFSDVLPRRLKPEDVASFVRRRIDATVRVGILQQAEKVIDHYDVQEVSGYLLKQLDAAEPAQSAVLIRIIARLGSQEERRQVQDRYRRLVEVADSTDLLEALTGVLEALGGDAASEPLLQAAQRRLRRLRPQLARDPSLKHEIRKLEDLIDMRIPDTVAANRRKLEVLAIQPRQDRLQKEISIYLGLAPGTHGGVLPAWAVRQLRREVWADEPPEQIRRADHPARRAELAASFRAMLPDVRTHPQEQEQARQFQEIRCLQAIEYFGGTLSPEEQALLERPGRMFHELSIRSIR